MTGRNFWEKLLLSETGLFLTLFGPKSYPLFMEYTLRTFLKLCGQLIQVVRKPDNKKYIFKKTISPKKGNFTPNWAKKTRNTLFSKSDHRSNGFSENEQMGNCR